MPTSDAKRIRKKKYVTLDQQTIKQISAFATEHGMNFSRSIEALALLSLQDGQAVGQAKLTASFTDALLAQRFARLSKLTIHSAIEAGTTKHTTNLLFFMQLLSLADQASPDDLAMQLQIDPQSKTGGAVVALYEQRLARSKHRAIKAARSALQQVTALLAEITADEPVDDTSSD